MSGRDRRPYLSATALTQAVLDDCQDNLDFGLEMVCEIQGPSGTIYASDRNKYVGGTFYEALLNFPVIKRTIGDWLSNEVEFSPLELRLSNVDGRFNKFLPGGSEFGGWIGRQVEVKVGLRDSLPTYVTIYRGQVTNVGGFQRDKNSIVLIARDRFDALNAEFPTTVLLKDNFPDLDEDKVGFGVPIIYGDWTGDEIPLIPAYAVNGLNAGVIDGTSLVELIVSENDNLSLDLSRIYLKRGETLILFDAADVAALGLGNRQFTLKQGLSGGVTDVDGAPYLYSNSDQFLVYCRGKDLGPDNDNLVAQVQDLLQTFAGVAPSDFDATWTTYRTKASPAQSSVATIRSRVWVQESQSVLQYALSMLEQLRLEMFVSRELKLRLFALHFEDFVAEPTYTIRNWDVEQGTFNPKLDDRNTWNRAAAEYGFAPVLGKNQKQTPIFRNQAAITQAGRDISKKVIFPNLYDEAAVVLQLKEMLRLASAYSEMIDVTVTPRSMLKDIGDPVAIDVQIGSTVFERVPSFIREVSYDPSGLRVQLRLWSLQMVSFPGFSPDFPATATGGFDALIEQES